MKPASKPKTIYVWRDTLACRDYRRWVPVHKYVIGSSLRAFDRSVVGFGRYVMARIEPRAFESIFGFRLQPGETRRLTMQTHIDSSGYFFLDAISFNAKHEGQGI